MLTRFTSSGLTRCPLAAPPRVSHKAGGRTYTFRAMVEKGAGECKELVSSGSHRYLDVRTPEEYGAEHAEGAVNVPVMLSQDGKMTPNDNFLSQVQQQFPGKDEQLVVGCKSGKRSAMAIEKMQGEGYTNLINLQGGYDAWKA